VSTLQELEELGNTIKRWLALRRLRRRFRLADKYTLDKLPEDTHGKVRGHATAFEEPLFAPLSGRPCLVWVVEVYAIQLDTRPLCVGREVRLSRFRLSDAGWHAIIDPSDAELHLVMDHKADSVSAYDATAAQKQILESTGVTARDMTEIRKLEYREAVIEIGEAITVLGAGTREADPEAQVAGGYRGEPQTRLRLTCDAITDDPEWL